jgi:RNA polymerase I-specific transcription initiation factor RRN5
MDIDLPDESDYEPSEHSGDLMSDDDRGTGSERNAPHGSRSLGIKETTLSVQLHSAHKWKRLQRFYNDQYLELFRETLESAEDEAATDNFQDNQIGAVFWTSLEKSQLFQELSKTGRHNLPKLSQSVGTKSEIEVKVYLDLLQSEEIDRQFFDSSTQNVTHFEIPAAIEIGSELEERLEQCADALLAFQEQYEQAAGHHDKRLPVVITESVASDLDDRTEEGLDQIDQAGLDFPHQLFNLCTFLRLSEDIFMHGSRDGRVANWRIFAENDETPAIMVQAVADFYDLVVNLSRRLVQATIFLTKSRLRACTSSQHQPVKTVQVEDVFAAREILNMREDLWSYWTRLPRRCGFKVVSGSHQRGDTEKRSMTYDDVEAKLSIRHHRKRRRSLSRYSEGSSESELGSQLSASMSGGPSSGSDGTSGEADHIADLEGTSQSSEHEGHQEGTASDDEGSSQDSDMVSYMSRAKRKRLEEEEADEHLEGIDQQSRRDEEGRILSILGFEEGEEVGEQPRESGTKPKRARKTVEDVTIWKAGYQAQWESHPYMLSERDNGDGDGEQHDNEETDEDAAEAGTLETLSVIGYEESDRGGF